MIVDDAGERRATVLVIPVAYENQGAAYQFCGQLMAAEVAGVEVCLADNSPESHTEAPASGLGFDTFRFPRNPGYIGAPRLVLAALVAESGPLAVDAVVVCNIDLEFPVHDLLETVERHRSATGDTRWVLAPDIREDGVPKNPNMVAKPGLSGAITQRALSSGFPVALAYRWLARRRTDIRADEPTATDVRTGSGANTMFAPHGSMMIFGSGYFTAGGSFPEGPLFNEELAIGKMAEAAGVPVRFAPELVVTHVGEETTGSYYSRRRYQSTSAAWKFYRHWRPEFSLGLMSTWFRSAPDSSSGSSR